MTLTRPRGPRRRPWPPVAANSSRQQPSARAGAGPPTREPRSHGSERCSRASASLSLSLSLSLSEQQQQQPQQQQPLQQGASNSKFHRKPQKLFFTPLCDVRLIFRPVRGRQHGARRQLASPHELQVRAGEW